MTKIIETSLKHLRKDKVLKKIIDTVELPIREKKSNNVFVNLLSSIVSQQLSTKAASTIFSRFMEYFKNEPNPQTLISTEDVVLRGLGLSFQKIGYVKNVAYFFVDKDMSVKYWNKKTDEEIISELTSIKGVGVWTVQMLLMFTFKREDVFPIDDLIIKNSIIKYYNIKSDGKQKTEEILKISKKWSPYRTIACLYLWASKDNL
ncbi:MAG: hypothetical protein RLZZ546_660 [Bacteroidota bacterium]|jgi:DNA-3-methyladenine glycosylase II